jgi:RNA polymerase sigma-32 factor
VRILGRKIAEFRMTLSDKELFVFDRRLMTEEPVTLQNIGERLGISRERVRQLECRMLDRFKHGFAKEFRHG